jgi:hypothetical protein
MPILCGFAVSSQWLASLATGGSAYPTWSFALSHRTLGGELRFNSFARNALFHISYGFRKTQRTVTNAANSVSKWHYGGMVSTRFPCRLSSKFSVVRDLPMALEKSPNEANDRLHGQPTSPIGYPAFCLPLLKRVFRHFVKSAGLDLGGGKDVGNASVRGESSLPTYGR